MWLWVEKVVDRKRCHMQNCLGSGCFCFWVKMRKKKSLRMEDDKEMLAHDCHNNVVNGCTRIETAVILSCLYSQHSMSRICFCLFHIYTFLSRWFFLLFSPYVSVTLNIFISFVFHFSARFINCCLSYHL